MSDRHRPPTSRTVAAIDPWTQNVRDLRSLLGLSPQPDAHHIERHRVQQSLLLIPPRDED